MTTYRSFVDALEAVSVTGVTRRYTQGPPTGAPAVTDCPAQYVRAPEGDEAVLAFGNQGGWTTLRAELVILLGPAAASRTPENFDATVTMMDNLTTALVATTCITKSKLTWSIRQAIDTVAGEDYWAIVAGVEGNG